jgi:preprotein translocase subunit SecG
MRVSLPRSFGPVLRKNRLLEHGRGRESYYGSRLGHVPVAGQESGLILLTLGVSPWIASLLVALFLLVCLLLILIVLIQRPQGGGLSGAFGAGGGGSGQTAFGAKTGDALTIATIGIFVLYLGLAVGLQFAARPAGPPKTTAVVGAPGGSGTTDENGAGDAVPGDQTPDDAAAGDAAGDAVPDAGTVPDAENPPAAPDAGGEAAGDETGAETETGDGTIPDGG